MDSLKVDGISFSISTWPNSVRVSLIPPAEGKSTPCNLILVVDGSFSMGERIGGIVYSTQGGDIQEQSVLDEVKNSINKLSKRMNEQDMLSLIGFSTHSKIYFDSLFMDDTGQSAISSQISKMWAGGQTNLWIGLQDAIKILQKQQQQGQKSDEQNAKNSENNNKIITSIFVITDGESTMVPSNGIIESLKKEKQLQQLEFQVHTFALGGKADTELLFELANENDGTYNFVENVRELESKMAHQLKRIHNTYSTNTKVDLSIAANKSIKKQLDCGSVQYGHSKDIIFKLPPNVINLSSGNNIKAEGNLSFFSFQTHNQFTLNFAIENIQSIKITDDLFQQLRIQTIDQIKLALSRKEAGFYDMSLQIIDTLKQAITKQQNAVDGLSAIISKLVETIDYVNSQIQFQNNDYTQNAKHNIYQILSQLIQQQTI